MNHNTILNKYKVCNINFNNMKRIILLIFLVLLVKASSADIVMSPYLQAVTTYSIYVLVECTTNSPVTVNYGLTTSYGSVATSESNLPTGSATYVHRIKLTGLTANTVYYYQAVHGVSTSAGLSFHTAVNPGTQFRFTWMADTRTGTAVHDQVSALILSKNPLFSLYGGDLCAAADYTTWKSEFFRTNELNTISKVPFFDATGNHEAWGSVTQSFIQNPSSASGTQDYYSFDYGDIHVLSLNNSVSYAVGSAQYNFAQSDLAATTKPWKIVINHNPPYCSGSGHTNDLTMQTMATNIFVPNHVDVVFNGHTHYYQHNYVSGIHYMILGTSGAPFYVPTTGTYTIKSIQDYCFGVVDVSSTSFRLRVINNLNNQIDSLILSKTTNISYESNTATDFNLKQNFPNPFNPVTVIKFSNPVSVKNGFDNFTSLKVYDLNGKLVSVLIEKNLAPGNYSVTFDGANLPSGVYIYTLSIGGFKESKRMTLLK